MNGFADALISREKSSLIPDEYDYWKDVIGSWNLDFVFGRGTDKERHVRGEWHFARILDGLGMQQECEKSRSGRNRPMPIRISTR